jgi:hypothetical protein
VNAGPLEPNSVEDGWEPAVDEFLVDLLDGGDSVGLANGAARPPRTPPDEFSDLHDAALRAVERVIRTDPVGLAAFPGVRRALQGVIIAEVLADRLSHRSAPHTDLDEIGRFVAEALDYFSVLSATAVEGQAVSHGIVIAPEASGLVPLDPPVLYPGRLPSRKRTPLLFDGTQSVLLVTPRGHAITGLGRRSLPLDGPEKTTIDLFDAFPGIDGALTAAASKGFRGIGVLLRTDRTIWLFDSGEPIFVWRAGRWKSIAIEAFIRTIATLGSAASNEAAELLVHTSLRISMQGHGAILAMAENRTAIGKVVQEKDQYSDAWPDARMRSVDDELHQLISHEELHTPSALARLARVDGATIVDTSGDLLAYGAIVHSENSRGEGARAAAARALSCAVNVALTVSQDGPITVFHRGEVALELL